MINTKYNLKLVFEKNPIFLGFIQLPTDYTLDYELPGVLNQIKNIRWRLQKMMYKDSDVNITTELYQKNKSIISTTASAFLPNNTDYGSLKVISMACTSLSFTLTPEIVHQEMFNGYNTITNDMASSILKAITAVKKNKLDKIMLLTPYIDEIHNRNIKFLKTNDCNIVSHYNLNLKSDSIISSISIESIYNIIDNMIYDFKDKIDIFIIGCNAFRVTDYGIIDRLEEQYKCIFITSNQAMIWNALQLAFDNIQDKQLIKKIKGYGKLFSI